MSTGWLAGIVILAAIGIFVGSLVAIGIYAMRVYRTVRYALKDLEAWKEHLSGGAESIKELASGISGRVTEINETAVAVAATVDSIREVGEEYASHPLVRYARKRAIKD